MTSISTSLNSGLYYSLNNSNTASTAANATSVDISALTGVNADGTSTSSDADAYLLDLSPDAQNYLQGLSSPSTSTGFTLTSAQQKDVTDILAKYKDAPFTQATYNEIQDDLKSAGLSPDTLSSIDKANSFSPTSVLINALNGNYTDQVSQNTTTDQTKANNYQQSIIAQWQSISTTVGSSTDDGSIDGGPNNTVAATSSSATS